MLKQLSLVALVICFLAGASNPASAQALGFTTEPMVPIGKFSKASDIGWGITGYMGFRLGRKSPLVLQFDAGAQWHAGDTVDKDEFPDLIPPDTVGDDDAIDFAGWMFPIRGSLTLLLGRAYVAPRAGLYIPIGDFSNVLQMDPSFGISPKVGFLFFVSRDVTADVGIEYNVVFTDPQIMYVGFSFGFLLGGERLPRRRLPY